MKKLAVILLCATVGFTSGNITVFAQEFSEPVIEDAQSTEETEKNENDTLEGTVVKETEITDVQKSVKGTGTLTAKTVTATVGCTANNLQELLDENAAGQYNLTVVIPAGTYKLTKSLYVYPNTTIKATGATLIKQSAYGAMIETKLQNDHGGYNVNRNIVIDGGIWDSKPLMSASEGTETFRFIHSSNIIVKNATLRNVPEGSHLIVLAGVKNATISNCKFYGYGNDGKGELTPKEAVQLDVTHSEVQVPTNQASEVTWDDLPCDSVTITGCEFYNFSRGIGSHTAVAGKLHNNITISGNNFHDLSDSAIRLYNFKNTKVSNNTINNVIEGILVYTYIDAGEEEIYFKPLNGKVEALPSDYNIAISGNTIQNAKQINGNWGDGIRVLGISSRPVKGVKITGNTISGMQRYGIFATTAHNMVISGGNKISSTSSDGILLEETCSNAKIYGNTISSAKKSGIALYKSDNGVIYSNTISSPKEVGIYLIQSKSCTIGKDSKTGNTISSPGKEGISLTTTGNTGCNSSKVQYNTIKTAGTEGIRLYKSTNVSVKNNTITAKENGIYVTTNSTTAKIENNVITSAGKHGIWLSSGSKKGVVSGNIIKKYGVSGSYNGIYVYKAGGTSTKYNTKILNNQITGSGTSTKKDGIKLSESSYTTVSKNKITTPAGCGIYVYKSKYCVIGAGKQDYNTIKTPTNHGIYLTTNCDSGKVQYNKISGAKKDGIGVYQSTKTNITNNTISAKGNGIYANTSSTGTKIAGNTISTAGKHGIWLSSKSKKSNISNNIIKKYATSGTANAIYVYQSGGTSKKAMTKVTGNKITGSGKSTKKDAIKLSNAAYTLLEKNTITSAPGAGIYIYQSKYCTVNKNTVKSPKKHGIYVTTNCDGTKITANTITKPGDTAIATYQVPKSTISSNKITTTSSKRGIWVSTSNKTQIKSNTIKGAKKSEAVVITSSTGCKKTKNVVK